VSYDETPWKHVELAQQLGGVPVTFRGQDVASTILAFARECAIKIVVVGKSRQPWFKRIPSATRLVPT
jgi:two-component system sensor histidine kinase KdpD